LVGRERALSAPRIQRTIWSNFDLPLLCVTLLLILIGGVMIYSSYEAALPPGEQTLWENTVFRQAVFAAVGMVFYVGVAALDYHLLVSLRRWIYAFVLGILCLTLGMGHISFGARSWVNVQAFQAQPAELCKVLAIIVLAGQLGDDSEGLESPVPFLLSALSVIVPTFLIYLQPDFGTALILLVTWLGMCFLGGVRWRHMLLLGFVGVILAPLIWFRLEGYMRDRVVSFLFPTQDPSGASYNITQALISIGSGGWWGKGLMQGTQSQLYFLRVRHTDFVFSVLAEELGFAGSMLVLGLFVFLILRLLRIAVLARDSYGKLIAGGVATMLLIQSFIHLGMNANMLPVTGLPLPLVSYGGSSLLSTLLALGLAQSVVMRHKSAQSVLF